jgi:ferritin
MITSKETLSLLQKQVSIENSNSMIYLELADWCTLNSYDKAASFFTKQAEGELHHRDLIRKFLLDIDVAVEPFTLEKAEYTPIDNLEDCVTAGLEIEHFTTQDIWRIKEAALKNNDYHVDTFIQWFITEQVEEEMLFDSAVKWIDNSELDAAPDWAKGSIRLKLNKYLGKLL